MNGTVFILPTIAGRGVPSDVRKAIDPRIEIIPVHERGQWQPPGGVPDFYITRNQRTKEHWHAARMGIWAVVLMPAQAAWLADQIGTRVNAGEDVYIYQAQKDGDFPWH